MDKSEYDNLLSDDGTRLDFDKIKGKYGQVYRMLTSQQKFTSGSTDLPRIDYKYSDFQRALNNYAKERGLKEGEYAYEVKAHWEHNGKVMKDNDELGNIKDFNMSKDEFENKFSSMCGSIGRYTSWVMIAIVYPLNNTTMNQTGGKASSNTDFKRLYKLQKAKYLELKKKLIHNISGGSPPIYDNYIERWDQTVQTWLMLKENWLNNASDATDINVSNANKKFASLADSAVSLYNILKVALTEEYYKKEDIDKIYVEIEQVENKLNELMLSFNYIWFPDQEERESARKGLEKVIEKLIEEAVDIAVMLASKDRKIKLKTGLPISDEGIAIHSSLKREWNHEIGFWEEMLENAMMEKDHFDELDDKKFPGKRNSVEKMISLSKSTLYLLQVIGLAMREGGYEQQDMNEIYNSIERVKNAQKDLLEAYDNMSYQSESDREFSKELIYKLINRIIGWGEGVAFMIGE